MTSSDHHCIDDFHDCFFGELTKLSNLVLGENHDAVYSLYKSDIFDLVGASIK